MKEYEFAVKLAKARAESQIKMKNLFLDDFMKGFREGNPGANDNVYEQVRDLVELGYTKGSIDTIDIMMTSQMAMEEGDQDD